jgi:hypothetical protein
MARFCHRPVTFPKLALSDALGVEWHPDPSDRGARDLSALPRSVSDA